MAHTAALQQTTAVTSNSLIYNAGARVCSLALRSVTETKDTLLLVCIGMLEALDRLQERLRIPSSIVKELRRKLTQMLTDHARATRLHSSNLSPPFPAHHTMEKLGDAIAESDAWDDASPEEVKGMVHWAIAVTISLNRLVLLGSVRMCRALLILVLNLPVISTACTLFYRMYQLVEDVVSGASNDIGSEKAAVLMSTDTAPHQSPEQRPVLGNYIDDPSLTAVVLEYREKECMVPLNINRRIQRVMHFQIPLRSFEATVRLPPEDRLHNAQVHQQALASSNHSSYQNSYTTQTQSSKSPRSIPVSPLARKRVQLAFSNFSDDVLYRARDRLRQERAAALSGAQELPIPRFNIHDCNEELYLSCGRHCATKVGSGMYRSVRGSVPIPTGRYVYFEMTLKETASRLRPPPLPSTAADIKSGGEVSVCIGLSTRLMPLNTLVGTSRYSIGFYSAGHVLIGSDRRDFVSVQHGYGYQSTVGVLVYADAEDHSADTPDSNVSDRGSSPSSSSSPSSAQALVRFCIDGVALRDSLNRVLVFTLPFPAASELFPTLTLHSQEVQVDSRFSAPDIVALNVSDMDLPVAASEPPEIWCLDGLKVAIASAPSSPNA